MSPKGWRLPKMSCLACKGATGEFIDRTRNHALAPRLRDPLELVRLPILWIATRRIESQHTPARYATSFLIIVLTVVLQLRSGTADPLIDLGSATGRCLFRGV